MRCAAVLVLAVVVSGAVARVLGAPAAPSPAPSPSASPAARSGHEVYLVECAACHGELGNGVGPGSPQLPIPPRDFTARLFKLKSTPTGAPPTGADLYATVTRGITARAMPV